MINKLFYLFCFCITGVTAQSVYNFETENIPYQDLTGSILLSDSFPWDDPAYTIPIGFDFQLGTFNFDTIYVVEWGLGGDLSSTPSDNGILPIVVPIGQDIISREDVNGFSTSPVSYKLEGTAGMQILKIEWKNFGFFDDSTENDFMNMQLWLYEGSNIIEYRYGPNVINNPNESYEGESGPYVSLFTSINIDTGYLEDNAYLLYGDSTNPSVFVFEEGDEAEGPALDGSIPSGIIYRFVPETLSADQFQEVQFNMYPNPGSNFIFIQSNSNEYKLSIYNKLGQKINSIKLQGNKFDVSNLAIGLYFIRIETKNGLIIKKFIKK